MEIAWLQDFLAVAECGSFSRAAELRHVTQPTLSRRIRSLEDWLGAPLFFRTTHKVQLSPAGESFRATAEEALRLLEAGRLSAREQAQSGVEQLQFAATNALALAFFPDWFRLVEASLPFSANIQLFANHADACERMILQGKVQFLLGYYHPEMETLLVTRQFQSYPVGLDVLVPVSAPDRGRTGGPAPAFSLPGSEGEPIPYLAYQAQSGMGRIISAVRRSSPQKVWLRPIFESHLAKLLVILATEHRGMAWLPMSLIERELDAGALVRAGDESWDVPMEIHLFRARARLSPPAEAFWRAVTADSAADQTG